MKHVIDLNTDTVIELRLPAAEGAGDEQPSSLELRLVPLDPHAEGDTAGFIQDVGDGSLPEPIIPLSLAGLKRLVVVCDPRPGPPPVLTAQDVQAFMMKADPKKEPTGENPGGGGTGGGPTVGQVLMVISFFAGLP